MSNDEANHGILAICTYRDEATCFELRERCSLSDLQIELKTRFPQVTTSLMFKYKAPFDKTHVCLIIDSDVGHMVRLHKILNMKVIDLLAEDENRLADRPSMMHDSADFNNSNAQVNSIDSWIRCIHGKGQLFSDVVDFRRTLKNFAIATRKSYKFVKNEKLKVIVECTIEGCPWRIYAAFKKSDREFRIRNCVLEHSCGLENIVTRDHPKADCRWVADVVQQKVRCEPSYRPINMQNDILRHFGVKISYYKAWLGKERAIKKIHGLERGSYDRLRWYCDAVQRTNPGSFADCEVYPNTNKFRRIFVCLHACATGFVRGCRPLMFLDGTHIKNKHRGCLLSAVSKDANDGLFTVAYSVVDAENDGNWEWFCLKLRAVLCYYGRGNFNEYTFFSDRNPGLLKAVPGVFHGCSHSYCLRHLVDNFKNQVLKNHPFSSKTHWCSVFKNAAYTPHARKYMEYYEEITNKFVEAKAFIDNSDPKCWANAFFSGKRWGIIDNNMAECWNSWVREARLLPVVGLLDEIRRKVMVMMNERRVESYQQVGRLCPRPENKLNINVEAARTLRLDRSSGSVFEVSDKDNTYEVNLSLKTCSCKHFQLEGIPCKHACSCIQELRLSPYEFCDSFFTLEKYRECYVAVVNPIPTYDDGAPTLTEDVVQPNVLRPPGRRRTKRIPSQVQSRPLRCGRCHRFGHNRRRCKESIS